MHDRMFRNGGNPGDYLKSTLLHSIAQFDQGIFICAVSIYADRHAPGFVAMDFFEPFRRQSRNTSSKRGDGNDGNILFCQADCSEICLWVRQVDFLDRCSQSRCKCICNLLRPTSGAENNLYNAHNNSSCKV